jgi:hypothetical protein
MISKINSKNSKGESSFIICISVMWSVLANISTDKDRNQQKAGIKFLIRKTFLSRYFLGNE